MLLESEIVQQKLYLVEQYIILILLFLFSYLFAFPVFLYNIFKSINGKHNINKITAKLYFLIILEYIYFQAVTLPGLNVLSPIMIKFSFETGNSNCLEL